ncbi:hypothetical protein CMUS01_09168 [Colletotrichum musicola]|uniref:Uncharacterized protein n=1 Tax=Colletotrichum musicola TaxID=2175873 RepID=A0A8H6K8P8_9PEZI|nr:hypothetical protein CMUS01_09168 [Colletotrichum musicola]
MLSKLTFALAMATAITAAPTLNVRQSPCQDSYNACVAAGTPEVACSCTLAACLGEDNARNREYCASATANLPQPTTDAGIPGGCNPAHPGSCPTPSADAGIPGGCNPAHPGSCPTPTADADIPGGCNPAHPGSCPTPTADAGIPGGCNPAHPGSCPTPSADNGIPGGCNPAHPGSCPTPAPSADNGIPGGCNPAHPGSCPTPAPEADNGIPGGCNPAHPGSCPEGTPAPAPAPAPAAPGPKPIEGKKWTIDDVSRYCGEGNTGCDINFKINTGDKTTSCTIIRNPGSNASDESWYEQPCTSGEEGSDIRVSWGFAADGAPPFSVITVVWGGEVAWFGVNDVNGQLVSPSNPYGSGQWGSIGPEQVYTFNN